MIVQCHMMTIIILDYRQSCTDTLYTRTYTYTPVEPNPPLPRSVEPSFSSLSSIVTKKGSNVGEQI